MSREGLVTKSTGSWYQLMDIDTKETFEARIRGKLKLNNEKAKLTNPLAVGDYVTFQLEEDNVAWITRIHPRKNYLIRKSVNLSKEAHIIASNIDVACILFTLKNPETSLGFLDRFLVCCEAYSISPTILFNKIDILDDYELNRIKEIEAEYRKIGYQTLQISAKENQHLDRLKDELKNRVSVFFGHSGAGKSTLINALEPGLYIKTSDVSTSNFKGRHTTTNAQMYFWTFGGSVIDTPGVREFAMIDFDKDEMQHFFPEIFEASHDCKFHNCMHIKEPQCAVRSKIADGDILESRYQTYLKLMEEAKEQQKK